MNQAIIDSLSPQLEAASSSIDAFFTLVRKQIEELLEGTSERDVYEYLYFDPHGDHWEKNYDPGADDNSTSELQLCHANVLLLMDLHKKTAEQDALPRIVLGRVESGAPESTGVIARLNNITVQKDYRLEIEDDILYLRRISPTIQELPE